MWYNYVVLWESWNDLMIKYYDKISLWSKLVNRAFIFTGSKKIFASEENTKKYIEKITKKYKKYNVPSKLGLKLEDYSGMEVYSYNGSLKNLNKKILLYIHGGSYIEEAGSFQIKFAMKIAEKTDSILIFPRYPLAPSGNYKIMYKLMDNLYQMLAESNQTINFLGDSAGGGFILSYAMCLREKSLVKPKHIVMMSPWIDVSLCNPDLIESEKLDYMSSIEGNKYAGELWADDLDTKNHLVSPLYGDFNNLGEMTIITGGRDLLRPDCLLLDKKLNELNIEHNYIEYIGQGHDFGAYPTKEGNMVIEDIANIVNGEFKHEQ